MACSSCSSSLTVKRGDTWEFSINLKSEDPFPGGGSIRLMVKNDPSDDDISAIISEEVEYPSTQPDNIVFEVSAAATDVISEGNYYLEVQYSSDPVGTVTPSPSRKVYSSPISTIEVVNDLVRG